MSKLLDAIIKSKGNQEPPEKEYRLNMREPTPPTKQTIYTRQWLETVMINHGLECTDNERVIDNILAKLETTGGHCPCGGKDLQHMCPCEVMRVTGTCKCGLFKSGMKDRSRSFTGATISAVIKD